MLVLSRKLGERIILRLEDRIVYVRIVELRRNKVRVGVAAPSDVEVHREEAWIRMIQWHPSGQVSRQRPNANTDGLHGEGSRRFS